MEVSLLSLGISGGRGRSSKAARVIGVKKPEVSNPVFPEEIFISTVTAFVCHTYVLPAAINLSNRCLMVLRMTQANIPLIEKRVLSSVTELSHYVLSNLNQSRVWNSFMNSIITLHPTVFGRSTHN